MQNGLRLGRVARTHVYVDWSWLFIALLLTWSLTDVFARWHPAWGTAQSVSVAACATLLFFASILVHELSHAAVGRAFGNPARRVTLWLFGGVSEMEWSPRTPREEFLTAVVGPVTSLALGVAFLSLGALGATRVDHLMTDPKDIFAALGPVSTLLLWLGPVNLALGAFNLLPAFPLDGGRVLRAALWASSGDLRRATRQASAVGQGVAWCFILAGIAMAFGARLPYFGTGFFSGLWLSFIGWFLFSAASRSWRKAVIGDALGDVTVARLMRRTGPSATPGLSLNRFVNEWLLPTDERAWPVLDGANFVGMVCLADVRKVPRADWDVRTIGEILTPAAALVTAGPDDAVSDALDKLTRRDVAQLPVVTEGRLVGMLVLRDITRWIELQPHEPAPPWGDAAQGSVPRHAAGPPLAA
jgi:Zn-dependent protease/CBS domain-containing protein